MRLTRFIAAILVTVAGLSSSATALCQNYPTKPIRFIAAEAGGIIDFAARLIAPVITVPLGQPVIVDNRGSGVMQVEIVSKAPPDGYTLLVSGSALWAEPLVRNVPYDPLRDLSPITLLASSTNLVVVHPTLPVNSIKELVALAKAQPGVLNYGSSTTGTTSHFAGELFKNIAGVDIVRIPYKGSGAALNALVGGQVQIMFGNASAEPHIKSGRLRALAVTSAQPSILFPGLPTVAASLPGYESTSVLCIFAPAKTPANVIQRLNQEIVRAANRTDIKERFLSTGAEVVGSSPEQLTASVKSEMGRLSKLIREAGIRPD